MPKCKQTAVLYSKGLGSSTMLHGWKSVMEDVIRSDFVLCHGMNLKALANNVNVGISEYAVTRLGRCSGAGSSGISSHAKR